MTWVQRILQGLGIFLAVLLLYLVVIIFFPVLAVPKQPLTKTDPDRWRPQTPPDCRRDVQFAVEGSTIRAWLYLPDDLSTPVPCIILSNGFGGTKDCAMEQYALRFVAAGWAALAYDYRYFGESGGQPRQLFAVAAQLDDLRTAIAYARQRPEIDATKLVLWGTSAAGGYGLAIAAEDAAIAAVISQCAGLDHDTDSKVFLRREGIGHFLRLFVHAQRDKGRSRFGLSPHTYPIVGPPGTMAVFTIPEAFEGYARVAQDSGSFRNEVCGRWLLIGQAPDFVELSKRVRCPVLFLACEHDNLVAPDSYQRAADILGAKATVQTYPIGHFDIYEDAHFERAMEAMLSFLRVSLN